MRTGRDLFVCLFVYVSSLRVKELAVGREKAREGNSLDYEQDDDLLGTSIGDMDRWTLSSWASWHSPSDHGRMEDGVLSPEDSDLAQLR